MVNTFQHPYTVMYKPIKCQNNLILQCAYKIAQLTCGEIGCTNLISSFYKFPSNLTKVCQYVII